MIPLAGLKRFMRPKKEHTSDLNTYPNYSFPSYPATSQNAGDNEMRKHHPDDDLPVAPSHTVSGATPYLGLRARLSQVWINKWTILLLLVLVRTLLAVKSLNQNLDSAKREALSACHDVESMGSAMASMPHYMSKGVNEIAASGVEKAVNGLMSMLMLTITGVEEMVVFFINLLTSTYVCLITLVISGALHVAVKVAQDVGDFLNKTVGDIGKGIHKDIDSFQADLNKFTGALNSVPKIFGSSAAIPKLNVDGSLGKLDRLQIPPTFDQGLDKLNKNIPTFKEVQNFTDNLIRTPFELVKKLVNESMVAFEFDRSVFPVPQKEQMTFCSDNDGIGDFFTGLVRVAAKIKKIMTIVILILALLVCIPMAYREMWRWRTQQKRSQLLSNHAFDPLDVVQIASRPYTSTVGIKAASRFRSPRRQILVRWFVSYATSVPALFVLTLGIAGLAACLCQLILLRSIEKEVPALAHEVGDFAGKVVTKLNNASEQWALGTNKVIGSTNTDINKEIFGWVNTTTGATNETLNAFVDQMSDALNVTFGGTILYDPIKEVLNCLIGLKIAGIQKALTWVSDHAHVDFPLLPNNTFSLGAATSLSDDPQFKGKADSFLSDPSSQAKDKITSALVSMTNKIEDGIRTEAIISACVILVWVAIVIIGLAITIFRLCGRDKTRAEGGTTFDRGYLANDRPAPAVDAAPPQYPQNREKGGKGWEDVPLNTAAVSSEKVGFAGERGVVVGQGHERASSYGVLGRKV